MLAPYPVRLRSHSTPLRSGPHKSDTSPQGSPATSYNVSPSPTTPVPVPSSSTSPRLRDESLSMSKENPLALFPSPSQPRKLFRLKRPSSSNSALRPTYERELLEPSFSSYKNESSSAPPRPPRNPARAVLSRRPQSSSGVPPAALKKQASVLQSRSPMRSTFMPNDPLAFPLVFSPDPQVQRRNSRRKTAPAAPQPPISEVTPSSGLQFSTADRTILEELKQKILAKDAQFRIRNRKRHHPHSAALVPYPTSYDRRILDNDIWETKSFQEACGSVTWHTFDEPPLRVLDLGCGAGTWILDSARLWKDTSFVGLDIVPLHPDLQQIGWTQLASRITWVQANFLESLPFQDEEFDYIHMKRVARGVPEHKWDSLFEELARVLKPGGALETIEEDLYFPGALRKANASQTSSYTFNLSPASDRPRAPTPLSSFYSQSNNGSAVSTAGTPSSGGLTAPRPPLAPRSYTEPLVPLLSRTPTDYTDATLVVIADDSPAVRTSDQISRASVVSASAPVNPRDHSTLEFIYNEMHAARFINLEPLSLLANTLSLYFKDMRTHPPVIASFPPLPAGNDTDSSSFGIGPWDTPQAPRKPTPSDPGVSRPESRVPKTEVRPSVTAESLRTGRSQFLTLDDSRMDAFSPSPHASFPSPLQKTPSGSRFRKPSDVGSPPQLHEEPKALPDSSQDNPIAFPKVSEKRNLTRLPNPNFNFDVGLLNLHLSLRVEEILGCAEAMWDYIRDYQHLHSPRRGATRPSNPPFAVVHRNLPKYPVVQPMHNILLAMDRKEFDSLLSRFEFDMKDSIGLGAAVENRLGWHPVSPSRSDARQEFDSLCSAWSRFQVDPTGYRHAPLINNESTALLSLSGTSDEDHSSSLFSHLDGTDDRDSDESPPHPLDHSQKFHVKPKEKGKVVVSEATVRASSSAHNSSGKTSVSTDHFPSFLDATEDYVRPPPPSERQCRTFRVMVAWKA